jgi:hypothetical protein
MNKLEFRPQNMPAHCKKADKFLTAKTATVRCMEKLKFDFLKFIKRLYETSNKFSLQTWTTHGVNLEINYANTVEQFTL